MFFKGGPRTTWGSDLQLGSRTSDDNIDAVTSGGKREELTVTSKYQLLSEVNEDDGTY